MPAPFRGTITGRSSTATLIRAGKDQFIRQLYARLGPREFYERRLTWLEANQKWTSYHRLLDYLEPRGLVDPIRLETRSELPRVSHQP